MTAPPKPSWLAARRTRWIHQDHAHAQCRPSPGYGSPSAAPLRSATMSLLVLLEIEAKDGKADEIIRVLADNLGDTRARPGCESVTVHRDQANPNAVLLVERWATRED